MSKDASRSSKERALAPQGPFAMTTLPLPSRDCLEPGDGFDFGPLADNLGYALRRAQVALFRDFFEAFQPFDVKPGQYSILTIVERDPGLKLTQVCDALGIKRANFVAVIDELESRGLVRRAESPRDRRSHALALTSDGATRMPKLHATTAARENRLVALLGAARHKNLARTLAPLAADLGEREEVFMPLARLDAQKGSRRLA